MIFRPRLANLKILELIFFVFAPDSNVESSGRELYYFLLPALKNIGFFNIDLILNCHTFLLDLQVGTFLEFDCLSQL